jgi:amidase
MRRLFAIALAGLLVAACGPGGAGRANFDVRGATLTDVQAALADGRVTSRQLVDRYLARIQQEGTELHAIISVNPNAARDAEQLDRERAAGTLRGALHGIPVVIKDNIDAAGWATPEGERRRRAHRAHHEPRVDDRSRER